MADETTALLPASVPASPPYEAGPTHGDTRINGNSIHDSNLGPAKDGTIGSDHTVYKGRWFILTVFSLLCCFHTAVWNTWGPIADTVEAVLGWTDADIALLANWGCISFVVTAFGFSYLLSVKGLRFCVLGGAFLLLLGVGIRCIPVDMDSIRWTANIGQICIGLSSPVMMAAPTEVSAVWFPPHQRTTSTAVSATAGFLGYSLSFLVGPLVVTNIPQNTSYEHLQPAMRLHYFNEIMLLMYIECGAIAIVVIAAMLYFPEKPPTPPSRTATKPRDNFKDGTLKMIRSGQFWVLAAAYSLTTGVYDGWMTQLVIILHDTVKDGQSTVGWIGFFSTIAATIGGLVVARFVDVIGRRMKAVLVFFIIGSCLSSLWCVLLTMDYISDNLVSLYIACISIGVCVNASVPIYFEITVEGLYPVSEGHITMVMTFLNNVVSLVFLLLPLIPGIGSLWMSWALLGSVLVCVPLILMYKERYNRLDLDDPKVIGYGYTSP